MTNGWGFTNRPYPAIVGRPQATRQASGTQNVFRRAIEDGDFIFAPPYNERTAKLSDDKISLSRAYAPESVNITVEEAAVLQSYPPDFTFIGNKGSQGLQVGNAVPPLLAQAILEELWS